MKNPNSKSKMRREHQKKFYKQYGPEKDSIIKRGLSSKNNHIEKKENKGYITK